MWNRNNPYEYSDPSGYCTINMPQSCIVQIVSGVAAAGRVAIAAVGGTLAATAASIVAILSMSGDDTQKQPLTVPPERAKHILEGDKTGGGHAPGANKPGKSEWPAGTSDEEIIRDVESVANDPGSAREVNRGDVVVTGTRNGVDIKVIIRKGKLWAAHPTNTPRNPK